MSKFIACLKSVHENVHDLKMKKEYSTPKIYDANGDLTKRWYVYFSFRNPQTGKLERQPNITTHVNNCKTLRDRTKAIKMLRDTVEEILKNGFNPYEAIESLDVVKKYSIAEVYVFKLIWTFPKGVFCNYFKDKLNFCLVVFLKF